MPATTPGFTKNIIRRSLKEVIDPSPTKKDKLTIWEFFSSECAYCGKKLNRTRKEGHIDHLKPSTLGGLNCISNRVLSCAACNEKEKRDMPWEEFLDLKNPDKTIASRRREKILKWQSIHNEITPKKETLDKIESLNNEVAEFYDKKLESARKLRSL